MRAVVGCLGVGILVGAACGGGSSTSKSTGTSTSISGPTNSNGRNSLTGQCAGSTSSQICTGEDAYVQCFEAACNTQLKAAFGSGYATGSVSGPCAPYLACELACPCDATAAACESNCYATDVTNNANCSGALLALTSCALSSGCQSPVCATNSTGTGTNTATLANTGTLTSTTSSTNTTTTNCAALQGCCATLLAGEQAAAYQQTCNQLTTYGDAVCLQVLSGWEQAGLCNGGTLTDTGTGGTNTATSSNTRTLVNTATATNTATLSRTATLTNSATSTLVSTGSNTSTTTNCVALASCCDTLLAGSQAATYQQSCAELTTAGDAVCLEILSSWQQAGICK